MRIRALMIILSGLLFLLTGPAPNTWGGEMSMVTYYSSPVAAYDRLQLTPQETLEEPCPQGAIAFNSTTSRPYFCRDNGVSAAWETLGGIWTQDGDYIYQSNANVDPLIFAGIGTSTPDFKLHLEHDGGILAYNSGASYFDFPTGYSGLSPVLAWYPKKSAFISALTYPENFNESVSPIPQGMVLFGHANNILGDYSSILGGQNTILSGNYSVTGASGNYWDTSFISGDYSGSAMGLPYFSYSYSYVSNGFGGEFGNTPKPQTDYITILGGMWNFADSKGDVVAGGGYQNCFDTSCFDGGPPDTATGIYKTIGGGLQNKTLGDYSTVAGGGSFNAYGIFATAGGGTGGNNTTIGNYSTLIGWTNNASGDYTSIGGGTGSNTNQVSGIYGSVGGGVNNDVTGAYSAVAGGTGNKARGSYSTVAGGFGNQAIGNYSTSSGGYQVVTDADYSWVGGLYTTATASAHRSFVWSHSGSYASRIIANTADTFIVGSGSVGIRDNAPGANVEINGNATADDYLAITNNTATPGDIFIIKNNGYIGIGKNAPAHPLDFGNGAHLTAGGVFTDASSREFKDQIQALDPELAVNAIQRLKPVSFSYKLAPQEKHIGFIAEDVPDIMAQSDRKSLSPMDFAAVLTAVAKEQQKQIEEQNRELNILKEQLLQAEQNLR